MRDADPASLLPKRRNKPSGGQGAVVSVAPGPSVKSAAPQRPQKPPLAYLWALAAGCSACVCAAVLWRRRRRSALRRVAQDALAALEGPAPGRSVDDVVAALSAPDVACMLTPAEAATAVS